MGLKAASGIFFMVRALAADVIKTFQLTETRRNSHWTAQAQTLHFLTAAGKHWRSFWVPVCPRFPRSTCFFRVRVLWGLFHAPMRAPVYVTLFLWLLNDAAAHQFAEEEMASIR